jgi:hypothetical protein
MPDPVQSFFKSPGVCLNMFPLRIVACLPTGRPVCQGFAKKVGMSTKRYPTDLTDDQWALIESLISPNASWTCVVSSTPFSIAHVVFAVVGHKLHAARTNSESTALML